MISCVFQITCMNDDALLAREPTGNKHHVLRVGRCPSLCMKSIGGMCKELYVGAVPWGSKVRYRQLVSIKRELCRPDSKHRQTERQPQKAIKKTTMWVVETMLCF